MQCWDIASGNTQQHVFAGMMTWDEGLHLISERGRLIGDLPAGGRMLAVFAPAAEVEKAVEHLAEASLAALNGTHAVVSGTEAAIAQVEEQFAERNIKTKALTTSHAFHSALMEPALAPFQEVADQVRFSTWQHASDMQCHGRSVGSGCSTRRCLLGATHS